VFADRTNDSSTFDIRSANFEKDAEKDIERLLACQFELLYTSKQLQIEGNTSKSLENNQYKTIKKQGRKEGNRYEEDNDEEYGELSEDEDDYILELKNGQLNDYCNEWKQTTTHIGIIGKGMEKKRNTQQLNQKKKKIEVMTVAQRLKQFQENKNNKPVLQQQQQPAKNYYEESIFGGAVEETIKEHGKYEETLVINRNMKEPTPPSSITKWTLAHSGLPSYDPILFQSMQILDELFENVWIELFPFMAGLIKSSNKRSSDLLDSPLSESGISMISSIASDDGINTIKVIPERSVVAMIPHKNAVNQNIDYGLSNSISIKTYKTFLNSKFKSLYQHDDFFHAKKASTILYKKKTTTATKKKRRKVVASTINSTTKTVKRKAKSTKRKPIKKGTSALEMYQFNARPRSVHSRQHNTRDGFFPARRANLHTSAGFRFSNKRGTQQQAQQQQSLQQPQQAPIPPTQTKKNMPQPKLPLMKPRHLPTSVVVKKPSSRIVRSPPRPRSRSYSSSLFQGFTQAFHQ